MGRSINVAGLPRTTYDATVPTVQRAGPPLALACEIQRLPDTPTPRHPDTPTAPTAPTAPTEAAGVVLRAAAIPEWPARRLGEAARLSAQYVCGQSDAPYYRLQVTSDGTWITVAVVAH
ncbi:hypothetical protein ACFWBX_02420 [Streptomyces sp. NPDC059991]|uniref:hypothetical protein n=1 Tax=Streptomyces sp. NPDC059991 TaxID=3347028 RepID=UPI0036BF5FB9